MRCLACNTPIGTRLLDGGGYDNDEIVSCHVRDIEPDGDWMTNLSADDLKIVGDIKIDRG
jgi:hypothetical protein